MMLQTAYPLFAPLQILSDFGEERGEDRALSRSHNLQKTILDESEKERGSSSYPFFPPVSRSPFSLSLTGHQTGGPSHHRGEE